METKGERMPRLRCPKEKCKYYHPFSSITFGVVLNCKRDCIRETDWDDEALAYLRTNKDLQDQMGLQDHMELKEK